MKQKDILMIVVVVIVSGFISFFLARTLFLSPKESQVKAEVVDAISTQFVSPSNKYFNQTSINPTQQIQIGDTSNATPFTGR